MSKTTATLRDRSVRELQQFYQKPIAKVSTELLITIIAVLFLAIFAIQPTLSTMSTLLKDIEDKKKVDEALTKKAAALSTLNGEIVPLSSQLQTLDKVIPNTPDLDGLLRRIEKLASEKPIVLSSIQTKTVPKDNDQELKGTPQLSSFTMQMNVKGSYANILAFLDGITRMDREIKLTNLSISTLKNVATNSERGSGDTPPELQMTISLQAQYYGIPVEADATTQ